MKTYLLTTFCLAAFSLTGFAREFTDMTGRKLDAELLSVSGSQATLKRTSDGGTFTVPITTFSQEDQAFINDFADASMKYKFDVRYARTKLDEKKERKNNTAIETETWAYKVDMRNLSSGPTNDIRVNYWCFRRRDEGKGKGQPEIEVSGTHEIAALARGATTQFQTSPVEISKQILDAGWIYTNGDKSKQADGMGGLVLKVFKGDREVFSFATKDDLLAMTQVSVPKPKPAP